MGCYLKQNEDFKLRKAKISIVSLRNYQMKHIVESYKLAKKMTMFTKYYYVRETVLIFSSSFPRIVSQVT